MADSAKPWSATKSMYVILWEFYPNPGLEQEFEKAYGPNGTWAEFFRKGEGYLGTQLLKGTGNRYITIDRWTSLTAYETFRIQNAEEYQKIDQLCETLTRSESEIGAFVLLGDIEDNADSEANHG